MVQQAVKRCAGAYKWAELGAAHAHARLHVMCAAIFDAVLFFDVEISCAAFFYEIYTHQVCICSTLGEVVFEAIEMIFERILREPCKITLL